MKLFKVKMDNWEHPTFFSNFSLKLYSLFYFDPFSHKSFMILFNLFLLSSLCVGCATLHCIVIQYQRQFTKNRCKKCFQIYLLKYFTVRIWIRPLELQNHINYTLTVVYNLNSLFGPNTGLFVIDWWYQLLFVQFLCGPYW